MTRLTNIISRWDDIKRLNRGEMIWPSFADFHTCNICNQGCHGCAYDGMLDKNFMPFAKHRDIVDQLIDAGVKAFDFAGGGEPSLLPYLPKLMAYIHSRECSFGMITNGLSLREDLTFALARYGTYVRFSLEASNETGYSQYKRVPDKQWEIVLGNIERLQEAKASLKSQLEISIKFSVGMSLRGREHYERCIELGRRLGAERVTIKALTHFPEELPKNHRIHEEAILREVIERESAHNLVSYWIRPAEDHEVSQCWLNPTHTVIDWNGDVYICCYFYYGRQDELRLGNLYEKSFREIWLDPKHREMISGIKRENCMKVNCKYFRHHEAVHAGLNRGHMDFL